ncbi:MAG: dihydrodipicolinate reductase [Ignavibacteria bacterium]|nr:dihydrodipicolinate reductase [Ignavibacteria bacterium]
MNEEYPKLAIIGYGSMGHEIEHLARENKFIITDIIDVDNRLSPDKKYQFDVAIDFSLPSVVVNNIETLIDLGKSVVVGTTGWYNDLDFVEQMVSNAGTGLIYGANFSLGVQIFMKLIKQAAKLANKTEDYDIMVSEIHHKRKKDSPSGTALSISEIILDELNSKNAILAETIHTQIPPNVLHVTSTRGGEVPGTHIVYLESLSDSIELVHRAKNRTGFASGALMAARWIHGRKGVYKFQDIFDNL